MNPIEIKTYKQVSVEHVDNGYIIYTRVDRMKDVPDGMSPIEKAQWEAIQAHNEAHLEQETMVFYTLAEVIEFFKNTGWP